MKENYQIFIQELYNRFPKEVYREIKNNQIDKLHICDFKRFESRIGMINFVYRHNDNAHLDRFIRYYFDDFTVEEIVVDVLENENLYINKYDLLEDMKTSRRHKIDKLKNQITTIETELQELYSLN